VVLQINYDVIKLQEYQLRRYFGNVIKLCHLKYAIKMTSQKFPFLSPSPLSKSWLRSCFRHDSAKIELKNLKQHLVTAILTIKLLLMQWLCVIFGLRFFPENHFMTYDVFS